MKTVRITITEEVERAKLCLHNGSKTYSVEAVLKLIDRNQTFLRELDTINALPNGDFIKIQEYVLGEWSTEFYGEPIE